MAELTSVAPIIRTAEQVSERWFYGGGVHRWLATSEDTGGAFLLFSDVMEQGKRTPLHTHPADESMYVIDGQILVHLAGEDHHVGAGGLVLAPRDVPHAFLVLSETATLLTLHTPGTCQAFYLRQRASDGRYQEGRRLRPRPGLGPRQRWYRDRRSATLRSTVLVEMWASKPSRQVPAGDCPSAG
jgi:Uncharacterized conserved protein, contains double-stranded beta-helix domain